MKLTDEIYTAFVGRSLPKQLCATPADVDEAKVVNIFCSRKWMELDCDFIEEHFEVIYFLSPQAFVYFIPGFIKASVEGFCPSLLAAQSLVGMLDRSPNPEMWDVFFINRWTLLTKNECKVLEEWLLWLSLSTPDLFTDESIDRCLETVFILKEKLF